MNNDFKIILEAVIDNSSLTDAQKKIAKEHFQADLNLDLDLDSFAKQKKVVSEQIDKLSEELKTAFKNAKFDIDDKQLATYTKEFISRIKEAAKEQAKLNALQEKQDLKAKAEAQKQSIEYQKREAEYIKLRNKYIAEGKQQERDFIQSAKDAYDSQQNDELRQMGEYYKQLEKEALEAEKAEQQAATAKEKAYQDAYKELKKLYDLRIEYAKIDDPDNNQKYLYENAISKQEDKWRKAYANTSEPENWDVQKRLELQRQEVAMQEKLEHAYGRVTEAKKQSKKVDEIQHSLDTEKYSKDIKGISDELAKVGKFTLSDQSNVDIFDKAQKSAKSLEATYAQLKSTMADANATDQQKIDIENKYQQELTTTKNLLSQIKLSKDDEIVTVGDTKRVNMIATLNSYLAKNTAMTKENKKQIEDWITKLGSSDDMTVGAIKKINSEFKQLDATLRKTGKLGLSMWDKFKQAIEKFGGWSLATGAITKVWIGMQKVYNEAINLDSAMTDLAMATDLTETQMSSLSDTYSDLAEDLNSTVTDVIESGTEWIKQGQSIADTETLIANAMILSKIGKLSSADSTKYLTSTMKGYKVAAEDTLNVVDKLSAVDMASATDVGGLAEGMSGVAASADLAGVSIDKLLGYLATIGEVTQSGMSEVGTTLNAVFSRMGNIKLSRLTDYETGEDLSNVETVLRGVQISLRDTDSSFRDFDEVLDETASRWSSFSDTQQRAIASAFAGTHHMNEFIILMENYGKALEYTEVSMNSSGEAMEKFSEYQDSVAAHTALFEKSVQDLANTAIDSGLINWFIDLGTFGVKSVDGLISGFKELTSLFGLLDGSMGGTFGALSGLLMNKAGIGERTMFQWRLVLRPPF